MDRQNSSFEWSELKKELLLPCFHLGYLIVEFDGQKNIKDSFKFKHPKNPRVKLRKNIIAKAAVFNAPFAIVGIHFQQSFISRSSIKETCIISPMQECT